MGGAMAGEYRFEFAPSDCKICITIGEGPNRMQMVGQNNKSVADYRVLRDNGGVGAAQQVDFIDQCC